MPQEFQILRCCDCEKFQVHHVKKAKKWQCKVCGLKQSMKRAFFIGSSRDCRVNVQKLNFQAGEQEMRKKLGESCSSVDVEIPSSGIGSADFDFSMENEVGENDWVDKNDGMDENDWVDENDWIDENDGFDENPSGDVESLYNRNSQNAFEDELPRKKQRCEYSESESVEEDSNIIHLKGDVKDLGGFSFLSTLKCQQDQNSSKLVDSHNNISSTDVSKMECKQECDSFRDGEENPSPGVAKSRSNSLLKPTHGFQLILNEAKKRRTDLDCDLDW